MPEQGVQSPIHRLTGRKLALARAIWLVLVAVILGIYLEGVSLHQARLQQTCIDPPDVCRQLPVQFTHQDFEQMAAEGFSPARYAALETVKLLFFSGIWFIVGGLLFIRKSDEPIALITSFFLVTFGTGFDGVRNLTPITYPEWMVPARVLAFLVPVSTALFLALFPNGKLFPKWTLGLVIFSAITQVPVLFNLDPPIFSSPIYLVSQTIGQVVFLYAQVLRYRRIATRTERTQTRWVLFGLAIAFGVIFILIMLFLAGQLPAEAFRPTKGSFLSELIYQLSVVAIPITVGISILRYRLFDIDVIIRRTLVYIVLTAMLGLVYFGLVILLEGALRSLVGSSGQVATVVSTLTVAALFTPLRRRVQDLIDRRFYRRKYNAEQALAEFAAIARNEVNLGRVAEAMVAMVQETMQPEAVSLWLKAGEKRENHGK